ncbi:MAG: glycosyltransferase family 39 protein [Patescibacteria group bacterium]|nr:glycosyltransferase family 39 protein [Patescibacteria group bacterium]
MGTFFTPYIDFLKKYWVFLCLGVLFILFLFTRTYLLVDRSGFGWDQTTIAWAVKHLLVDHQIQLIGMPAKLNTGFYIGPLYYYYAAIFFWATNLDPIASPFITVSTAIINFFVLFFVIKKLFNASVALVAAGILTFSAFLVASDHSQWPVTFIPAISILIFYALYRAITKDAKYLLLLGFFIGLSFHIHFTAVFFPMYTLLALPLLKRSKQTLIYIPGAAGIMLMFLIPNIIFAMETNNASGSHLINYLHATLRMFHGRHFLQLMHDAFIQFDLIFSISFIAPFVPLIPAACIYLWSKRKSTYDNRVLSYLVGIWILIPWITFTVYTGELTDYYFSVTRPIAIFCVAFLAVWLWQRKLFIWKLALLGFGIYVIYANILHFLSPQNENFTDVAKHATDAMQAGQTIPYSEGVPEAYFYYAYTREKTK